MKLFLATISNGVRIKKNTKKILPFLFFGLLFLIPTVVSATTYTPMETIPGYGTPTDFFDYVAALYKFGIGAVGIAAMIMVTIGGFMYISSAGNNASMEKAKGVITDAIVGLLLALSAYIILYTINPDLVKLKKPTVTPITITSTGTGSTATGTTGATAANPNNLICSFNGIDQAATSVCTSLTRSSCGTSTCSQYSSAISTYASQWGVAESTLKSFMVIESDCDISRQSSTSYGLMQISPSSISASMRSSCGVSNTTTINSAWLTSSANASASICLAAGIISSLSTACGTNAAQIYAGYNAGSGNCSASSDCSTDQSCFGGTMSKWECPYDSGKTACNTGMQETRQGAGYIAYCSSNLGF